MGLFSVGVSAAASVGRWTRATGTQRPLAGGSPPGTKSQRNVAPSLSCPTAQSARRPLASATAVGHGKGVPTPGLAYGARRLSVAHPLVSPAGSVGSRQSATGARSPPPVNLPGGNRRLFCTGGGEYSILSFQRGILSRLPARSVAGRVPLARSDPFGNPLEGQASQPSAGGFEAPTPTSPAGACPRWAIKSLRKLRDFGRVDPTLANSAPLTCQVNRLSAAHPRPAAGDQRPMRQAGKRPLWAPFFRDRPLSRLAPCSERNVDSPGFLPLPLGAGGDRSLYGS